MARPTRIAINSGNQGWDALVDDDFVQVYDQPFPIHESAGLTEANLQATFPAAAFDRCLVWVNHTVYGYVLYQSDGTNWIPRSSSKQITRTVTVATTFTAAEMAGIILSGGTLPYTHVLPTSASMKGRKLIFKTLVAGTLTIDGSGAELIDGVATITITAQYGKLTLFADGTGWLSV
jgi:hypothetical protein